VGKSVAGKIIRLPGAENSNINKGNCLNWQRRINWQALHQYPLKKESPLPDSLSVLKQSFNTFF
jgi:hypothetical protein